MHKLICLILLNLITTTIPAYAYLGPGMGAGVIAATVGIIVAIFAAIFGILWFPIKRFLKKLKEKKIKIIIQINLSDCRFYIINYKLYIFCIFD